MVADEQTAWPLAFKLPGVLGEKRAPWAKACMSPRRYPLKIRPHCTPTPPAARSFVMQRIITKHLQYATRCSKALDNCCEQNRFFKKIPVVMELTFLQGRKVENK